MLGADPFGIDRDDNALAPEPVSRVADQGGALERRGVQRDLVSSGAEKGSGVPNKEKVGKITSEQVKEIAALKLKDLNTTDINKAMKIVKGTARSMGIEVPE